jgi:hypothetical protein
VDTPKLVEEFLVPSNKVGKCLCQHPRDYEGYHNGGFMHGSKIGQADNKLTLLVGPPRPRSMKVNQLAYLGFYRAGKQN